MLRITPDTNIYISAFMFGGKPLRLLEMALEGEVRLAISDAILEEALGVLRDKFGLARERLLEAEGFIKRCTERVTPVQTLDVVQSDPHDNRVLECAVAAGSDAIVSGDSDLLGLRNYSGIKIMKVAEFLKLGPSSPQ